MAIVEVPRSSPSVLLELALNRSARGDCDDPDTTSASLATAVAAAPSVSIEPGRYAERLLFVIMVYLLWLRSFFCKILRTVRNRPYKLLQCAAQQRAGWHVTGSMLTLQEETEVPMTVERHTTPAHHQNANVLARGPSSKTDTIRS